MKKIQFYCLLLTAYCLLPTSSIAQTNVKMLTIQEVIEKAREQSPDALIAKSQFQKSYWQYRVFKTTSKPAINLEATLPDFNHSIDPMTLDDGTETFVTKKSANSFLKMSLKQPIGWTGGELFINSDLRQLDNFAPTSSTSYSSTPVLIGITQPLFSFNKWRWDKKIEPLKYQEAKKKYVEELEQVSIKAIEYFFDLLLAQINLEIALKNQQSNKALYKIATGRYNLGRIAENGLLQVELSLLNANIAVEQAKLNMETATYKLNAFLSLNKSNKPKSRSSRCYLIIPKDIVDLEIDAVKAISQAQTNTASVLSFQRQLTETQRDLAKVKGDNAFRANLFLSYGLTNSAPNWSDLYANSENRQKFRIGLQFPIFNWGRTKALIKVAEANQQQVQTTIKQEQSDFEQEIYLKVRQFNIQKSQLSMAAKADTVGQKRYKIAKQRFMIGKISITELNIALKEKDQARQNYIATLRNCWLNYHQLRKLSLYDFEKNTVIDIDAEDSGQ